MTRSVVILAAQFRGLPPAAVVKAPTFRARIRPPRNGHAMCSVMPHCMMYPRLPHFSQAQTAIDPIHGITDNLSRVSHLFGAHRASYFKTSPATSRPVPMFTQVASLLALLPMLLHSILGCCWHHAHHSACNPGNSRVVCQSSVEPPADAHSDHAASPSHHRDVEAGIPGELPTDPSPHSPCDEERCLFASTSMGVVSQTVALEWGWCDSFFVATVELPVPVGSLVGPRHELLDGLLPPSAAQRRALTQVWLI